MCLDMRRGKTYNNDCVISPHSPGYVPAVAIVQRESGRIRIDTGRYPVYGRK